MALGMNRVRRLVLRELKQSKWVGRWATVQCIANDLNIDRRAIGRALHQFGFEKRSLCVPDEYLSRYFTQYYIDEALYAELVEINTKT